MAQLTSRSPIFCQILKDFATKEITVQPRIRTPDLLHMKPVCYHSAMAASYVRVLKVGYLNHLKYSQVSTFLSEINKAISDLIYLVITLRNAFLADSELHSKKWPAASSNLFLKFAKSSLLHYFILSPLEKIWQVLREW